MVHRPSKQLFEYVHEGTESSMCVVEIERQEIETGLYYSAFYKARTQFCASMDYQVCY